MNTILLILFILHAIYGYGYHFDPDLIDNTPDNGSYFVISHDFDKNGKTDLLTGSTQGSIIWFRQGSDNASKKWTKTLVGILEGALHADVYDVNDDGFADIVVAHNFGGCPYHCSTKDGHLSWLENPQGRVGEQWKVHDIAQPKSPPHRVAILNKYRDRSQVRIISIPITGISTNETRDPFIQTSMSISAFSLPNVEDLDLTNTWKSLESVIAPDLNLCHLGRSASTSTTQSSDSGLLLACLQGALLYEHVDRDVWKEHTITQVPPVFDSSEYTGLGAIGQTVWKDSFLYPFIAPFHDGHVGFIYKQKVYELDFIVGKGGHDVQVAHFDSDAFEIEFVCAFWGSDPGIFIYSLPKNKDPLNKMNWIKTKIYGLPVSMMTIGDFNGDGRLDIASMNSGNRGDSSVTIHYHCLHNAFRSTELWLEEFDEE